MTRLLKSQLKARIKEFLGLYLGTDFYRLVNVNYVFKAIYDDAAANNKLDDRRYLFDLVNKKGSIFVNEFKDLINT